MKNITAIFASMAYCQQHKKWGNGVRLKVTVINALFCYRFHSGFELIAFDYKNCRKLEENFCVQQKNCVNRRCFLLRSCFVAFSTAGSSENLRMGWISAVYMATNILPFLSSIANLLSISCFAAFFGPLNFVCSLDRRAMKKTFHWKLK